MRTAFILQLIEEARKNPKIFLIVGDLGFSVVEPFAKEFPDRFLNAGIAEQNMTGIAAGLAMEGYTVFTYSIANFSTLRCMEQIRYDVCYHNLDVKVVAVGGGFAYASLGPSHHATEDLGMMRVIPNIQVVAPGDPVETKLVTSQLCNNPGPAYLRLGKAGEPIVHSTIPELLPGRSLKVLQGEKVAVLTTGSMLKYSYDYIIDGKYNWSLYSFPYVKPIDSDRLKMVSEKYDRLITIEEHQQAGGFGTAVLEEINSMYEKKIINRFPYIKRIGIQDEFISIAGSQEYIRNHAGLVI